jgi:HEAT repeat protein
MRGQSITIPFLTAFTMGGLLLAACQSKAADLPAGSPSVSIEGERLSLHVERMPLSELLASISRRSPVAIEVRGDLTGRLVSASFEDIELRRALRRLLSDHSYLLIEQETSAASAGVIEVILLGAREGASPVPAASVLDAEPDGEGAASTSLAGEEARLQERPLEELVDTALSSGSAETRAAAVDAIAYAAAGGEKATYADQVLMQSLSDPDEQVRAQALETLKDTGDEVPVEALARMAREDPSPDVRIQALELLVERAEQGAHAPLRTALIDPEPAVQERASELIEDGHIVLDGT